jgi:hypothetical protein
MAVLALKVKMSWVLVVCIMLGMSAGCANEMALLRPGTVKTFTVQNADYDTAFSQAVQTAKELQFKIGLEDKARGRVTTNRGLGYGESSYLWIEVKKIPSGNVSITLDVKSSGGSENIVNEFMVAYNKRVKTL